ncbi:aspartate aminotransferase family protein [Fulvivirgaceae bacterium PWU4]|uniref:Aspartate aminotransferase family protein n=1 Tax=Chryseosolibacter histidini TaxID=2782349 RepID=A0AAP2DFB7_9BACT|nr:aspartate aminotransferase family protein [Chryseosolibacter histidini]MBT1695448.1 aspartate aminotransferase family protein [Chryseosolibacter histidini]
MNNFESFHLAENASVVSPALPGKKSKEILAFQQEREGSIVSYPRNMPIAINRAKGAVIEDADGNLFLDFFSGAGVLNVGHCNAFVLEYVKEQQEKLVHALDFPTENRTDLVRKIFEQIPEKIRDEFKVSFCGPTGSDAVEAAIKLAKHKTGREGVIAFHGSYHGMTSGALSVTSNVKLRSRISSLVPNISFIPYSYCYRCPFNKEAASCKLDCADYLRYVLENPHSGFGKPAAIILEPIQGEGGTVIPRPGFLEKIVAIARAHDIVVIFDEIQCGFFRTGNFWAFEDAHTFPDIITMSKGLGGIGFPISAIIYNKSVESWGPGDHIGTFRGNQVSIAAGNGAFEFIRNFDVAQHTIEMGAYLMNRLEQLKATFPCIGEVRGKGLMIGIEYVTDRTSKTPAPEMVKKIRELCFSRGLLFEVGGHYNNVIRFLPPLIINKVIINNAMEIFESANREVMAQPAEVYQA